MEQSIIKALENVCGNKNIKFQVVVRDHQLHVYANHRKEYQPNYSALKENVSAAIASLDLDTIDDVWLYTRPLGQIETNWQSYVERATSANNKEKDLEGSQENLESTIDFDREAEFNFAHSDSVETDELVTQNLPHQSEIDTSSADLVEELELTFVEFEEDDSSGDTGLLRDTGLIHGHPLKEAEINATYNHLESQAAREIESNSLKHYCFVTNKKLLVGETTPADKDIMRMVKFLHHLSRSDRQQLLPILDSYCRQGTTPELESTSATVQSWFGEIKELTEEKRYLFAVWLSRYCANPTETLAEFKAFSAKHSVEEAKKQSNRSTEYNFISVKQDYTPKPTTDDEDKLKEPKFQLPPAVKKLLLPLGWTLGTIFLIVLATIGRNSNFVVASAQIPQLCQNTIGTPEYCRLGVNLAGKKAIVQTTENLFPLTEVTETVADYGCARYANLKAGINIANIDPKTTPVISSQGEKIFPHIYTTVVEQKNARNLGNIKVGCVYSTGAGQRSPKKLAAEVIPVNWPTQHYQRENRLSFGIYAKPINLGLYTIFAALGIAIAARLNLGLRIDRTYTIYLVALVLGLVQLTTASLPSLGLIGAISIPILTIIAASFLFRDFQFDWRRGYPSIAISVLVIVAIQVLFYSVCLGLLGSLV